jgi:phosphonate transport system ATP-binding protein
MGSQIQVFEVKKVFGQVRALDRVSLTVEAGEVVAILGPSGSGKSTLMRCINGLETPTSGAVHVEGLEVRPNTVRAVRRRVGMIFQRFNLVPRSTVMSNVLVGRLGYRGWVTNAFGWFPGEDFALAEDALREVKLLDRAWDRADRLSGGQQQRVGIARAIVQQTAAILADEPVASLDRETSHEVMRLLLRVARERGTTLLINLHQVELAKGYADRIVGLRAGQIEFDLPSARVEERHLDLLYGKVTAEDESGVVCA